MESNVLLRIFSLDHFLVLELEARLFAVFSAQNHNAAATKFTLTDDEHQQIRQAFDPIAVTQ